MSRVRTHKVHRGGKTYVRRAHTRAAGPSKAKAHGWNLQPRRAVRNAKRSHKYWGKGRHISSALFAGAAVSELLAFTVFRSVGGLLAVAGIVLAATGQSIRSRT